MNVHCPDCSHEFECTVFEAGEELNCPSCAARFRISAKETVFYLDNVNQGGGTMVVGPSTVDRPLDGQRLRPGDRLGGFVIERELGRGGMGVVYLANQISLGKQRALKVLLPELAADPDFLKRFGRETRALSQLDQHPNIISVIDTGHYQGLYYLVMEYVEGITLRELLEEHKLSAEDALKLVPQICSALQYAHTQGVIHRDIKPENIIIDRQHNVRIADFGLSKILGEKQFSKLTATNTVMGTYEYMAPEQKSDSAGVDHRADLYSLGVIIYEMLTGDLPAGNFEPPSKRNAALGPGVDRVIMRVLERDPERRYQKASELATDIAQAGTGQKTIQVPRSLAELDWARIRRPLVDFVKRHNWWFYVALILLFFAPGVLPLWVFVGLTVWFWDRFDDSKAEEEEEPVELPAAKQPVAMARAGDAVAVAQVADAGAKGQTVQAEVAVEVDTGRTSGLAIAALICALPLLIGGLSLLLMTETIRDGLLYMSTTSIAAILVGVAAGVLIPGLGLLWFCSLARRRCATSGKRGRGMATVGLLCALFYLGCGSFLFYHGLDDWIRWRTIERLALQRDARTLDGLETEVTKPAMPATRIRAARLLARNAPERAVAFVAHTDKSVRMSILEGFGESNNDRVAVKAAMQVLAGNPEQREAELACAVLQVHPLDEALPLLRQRLAARPAYTNELVEALLAYRTPRAIPALVFVASEKGFRSWHRTQAVSALSRIGTPAAARGLLRLLECDSYKVRSLADRALRRVTTHQKGTGFEPGYSPHSGRNERAIEAWRGLIDRWDKRHD